MSAVKEIRCPACGAESGDACVTVVDGVDTGWDHDARILAPIIRDLRSLYCNCCFDGCDCGCAEDCGLLDHKPKETTDGR